MKISARSVLMAGVTTLTASRHRDRPVGTTILPSPGSGDPTRGGRPSAAAATAALLTVLLRTRCWRLLGPASTGQERSRPAPVPLRYPSRRNSHRQRYRQRLPRRRAVGCSWASRSPRTPSAGFLMSAGSPAKSWSSITSASRSFASSVFNFTDWLAATVASSRTWSTSASTSSSLRLPGTRRAGVLVRHRFLRFRCCRRLPLCKVTFLAADTLLGPTETPVQAANADGLRGLLDRVLNPLDAGGAIQGDASLGSLVKNGLANLGDLLGVAVSPQDPETTSDISTVPSIVKTPFAPLNSLRSQVDPASETGAGPLTELRETVRNARNVIREATGRGAVETLKAGDDAKTVGNEVVRTQGGVRGAVTEAVSDVTNALRPNKTSKSADGATTTSTNVVKSFGDTAKKVVKQVREAAKDARDAVKNRPASDADE